MTTTVLITGKLHPNAIESFQSDTRFELHYMPDCSFEDYAAILARAHVLVTRSETTVDRRLLDHANELKIVARAAVGVGNIDLEYATEKGILVMNTPGKNTNSAAELTLALLLGMMRLVPQAHQHMKNGGWDRHQFSGYELRGKKIGIVGLGNVGHRVAKFCRGFDAEVYAYDPYIAPQVFGRHGTIQVNSLLELAEKVDVLSVHVPKIRETTGMITADILKALGPKAYFVNAARGGVANEEDLLRAVDEGWIAGAALDTFDNEPHPRRDLVEHERVWVSPHIGASTEEAQLAIGETVYSQVVKAVDGAVVDYHVNLPEIGVIDRPILKSYSTLAEKLGSIIGQILDFNPVTVNFQYRGDIAELDNSIIRLSWMKGYATHVVSDYVSFVNVTKHFENLGVELTESTDPNFTSYKSAIKISVQGRSGECLTIGGVVFDDRYPRVTLLNDFYFEVDPSGPMVMIENLDRPGVIGDVGQTLAKEQINISSFNLSRNTRGGKAMALLNIDENLTQNQVKVLRTLPNIKTVKAIKL